MNGTYILACALAALGGLILYLCAVRLPSWKLALVGLLVIIIAALGCTGAAVLSQKGIPIGP